MTPEALEAPKIRSLLDGWLREGEDVTRVEAKVFAEVAATEAPQGIALVVQEPSVALNDLPAGRFVLLDGVQDPGNAGTLLRSAWAFGLTGAVALDGTVDVWNPKAVRAAAGAGFHLAVARARWEEARDWLGAGGRPLFVGADGGRDVRAVEVEGDWALAVGNEGRGPRRELVARARETLSVPMPGGAESLNAAVAGSVLLWELTLGRER